MSDNRLIHWHVPSWPERVAVQQRARSEELCDDTKAPFWLPDAQREVVAETAEVAIEQTLQLVDEETVALISRPLLRCGERLQRACRRLDMTEGAREAAMVVAVAEWVEDMADSGAGVMAAEVVAAAADQEVAVAFWACKLHTECMKGWHTHIDVRVCCHPSEFAHKLGCTFQSQRAGQAVDLLSNDSLHPIG